MGDTIYEKYGGFSQISRIVLDFYDRVLEDDDLGPYFEAIDMGRMVDHQTKFIASLLGGPAAYTDEQLRLKHRHLGIRGHDFDVLKGLLGETLADHGMAADDVALVIGEFERRRILVVTR